MRIRWSILLFTIPVAAILLSAQDKPVRVLIGGSGSPQHTQDVLNNLTDFLREKGVAIKQMPSLSQSRDAMLTELANIGGESLIYVSVDIGIGQPRDKIVAQCFSRDGKKLWEEQSSSILLGTPGRLANGMKKNLEKHLGKVGLTLDTVLASEDTGKAAPAKKIGLNQTPQQVEAILGKPETIIDLGPKITYVYKSMKVIFTDGKVTDVQ